MASVNSFGDDNSGFQAGIINGPIHASFHPPERPETPPNPTSTVPFRRDPDFIGRREILDQIQQKCAVLGSWTALVGLGGVGKSQVAIEYAYRIRRQSPDIWVFWIHASNAARFEQSYRDVADVVKIPGRQNPKANIFKLVYHWLYNNKRQWILILDNVDDARFLFDNQIIDLDQTSKPLRDYLPQSEKGSVLITTRTAEAALKLVEESEIIPLSPMNETDALALFEKKLKKGHGEGVAELAAALEFMPLAIVQAAAYISQRAPRFSVRQYLEQFRKNDDEKTSLLDVEAGQLRRDREAKNSIIITWDISFNHIRKTRPSAADLLSLISMFDCQGIPENLVRNRIEIEELSRNQQDQKSCNETKHIDQFEDDLIMLRNYSFVFITGEQSTFEMHTLVQLAMRKWLKVNGQLERWRRRFIRILYAEFPTGEYENWVKCQMLFPHAKLSAEQQLESHDILKDWASLQYKAAWYAWRRGSLADAEKLAVQSMEVRKKLFGQEHEDTLSSMGMVGLAYHLSGRWNDAEKLEVQVMKTRKRVLGQEHPSTLTSMANLASTYRNQGRWNEAEKLEVQVMETSLRVLGQEHPDTLVSMANLASTYRNQGRWNEAEKLDVQVMETRMRVLGQEHPSTLTSMANLASTYRNQGRWNEAKKLNVQVMETRKRVLGQEHPDTLTSMNNLAFTWKDMNQDIQAICLMEECVQLRRRILGANHPYTLSSSATLTIWEKKVGSSSLKS